RQPASPALLPYTTLFRSVQRYIGDCLAGTTGPRGKDFNMRWVASMVADVNRIMMRGGVFMYPADNKDPSKPGRLRLMYEAAPMRSEEHTSELQSRENLVC